MINEELICFAIASFVSADSNTNNEERKQNIESLKKMKEKLPTLSNEEIYYKSIDESIKILEKEIEENL